MDTPDVYPRALPDAALSRTAVTGALRWVGMEHVQTVVRLSSPQGELALPAKASVMVSLDDAEAKGVHMSRLFLLLDQATQQQVVSVRWMADLLRAMLDSHEGLSTAASVQLAFTLPLRRAALRSANSGWRHYPFVFSAEQDGLGFRVRAQLSVVYSSTCPSSAALARQLVVDRFDERFPDMPSRAALRQWLLSEDGMAGTPHAQRSELCATLELEPDAALDLPGWIDALEQALPTPVQTAVKRIDEQAFAALNASNLMFCEDAARRAGRALRQLPGVRRFSAKAIHRESLHAHDAVAVID